MIHPPFLSELFSETYNQIKTHTREISFTQSLIQPLAGINCLNWLVGHIVVARCNFLIFLNVPSIWGKEEIMRYIPGSTPILDGEQATPFDRLLSDLDQTQEQLQAALANLSQEEMNQIKGNRSLLEHLVFYLSHEAQHAGQIEVACLLLKAESDSRKP